MSALWMLLASFLFACMGVCVKFGAVFFSAGEMVFYRGVIGVVMMVVIARSRGIAMTTPHWRMQLSRGLSGSIALTCYFFALSTLPIATAVTLSYTSPIFIALLLLFWFREQLRWQTLFSVIAGFLGVALLLHPTLEPHQWLGAMVGLSGGALASIAYLSVRELGRVGEPEVRTVLWFSAMTAMVGLPWTLVGGIHGLTLQGAGLLAGIGIFGGFAQIAMTRAYRYGKTMVAATLSYSTVLFASVFGIVFWSEMLPLSAWGAVGLIVSSGIAVSLSGRSASRAPKAV